MFRHLKKNFFTTALNIIGLSVAFAAFIIILIQVQYDLGYNKGCKDSDRIFRVEGAFNLSDMSIYSNYLSRPLAAKFGVSSPDIEAWGDTSQWNDTQALQKAESDDASYINVDCDRVRKGVLDVLGYEIISGDTSSFESPGNAILSESLANEFFPNESPLGKVLRDKLGNQYTIIAVFKDFPENCFLNNGIVIDMGKQNLDNTSEWSFTLFVKLNSAENASKVAEEMANVMADMYKDDEIITNAFKSEASSKVIRLTPIHDIHFTKDMQYDWCEKASLSTTYSLFTIAILIIVIAIINFINFSMAGIPLTIKSINTRKVLGCTNSELRIRQIMEAVIISLVSWVIGIFLVYVLAGTSFASFISGSIAVMDNVEMVILAAAVAILTGVVAGIYPAIYSTSFSPALVVKGSFSLSPKGRILRSSLVALQYVISLVLIVVALFINVQSRYMKNYDMGFRSNNILTAGLSTSLAERRDAFVNNLKTNPNIIDVAFSRGMLISTGKMGWGRYYNGQQIRYDCFPVSTNFVDFFGMKILEGRGFVPEDETKSNGTYIFNETAMKTYPFIHIGDKISGHNSEEPADVVGVAKNFNFQPLHYKINSIAIYQFGSEPWWPLQLSYIKTVPGSDIKDNIAFITRTIKEMDPQTSDEDISVRLMDDSIDQLYQKEDSLGNMILIFCGLSVLISIIGILGLIYFETQFKKKEIGVRRIFGSSVTAVLKMLNLAYIKIASICFVISIPISLIIIKQWLKTFTYQAPIPVWIFIAAYVIILAITILVITLQSYRTVASNPIDSIRNE